jgi:hypothetical protein
VKKKIRKISTGMIVSQNKDHFNAPDDPSYPVNYLNAAIELFVPCKNIPPPFDSIAVRIFSGQFFSIHF